MYHVREEDLEKLILSFKKVLNGIDQSGLSDGGLQNLLKISKEDIRQGHIAVDVIKDELKLFRAEGPQ